ncbi:hydrogenase nickel incorporation protein HypA/HybF [Gammaproteobacteria bacterium]
MAFTKNVSFEFNMHELSVCAAMLRQVEDLAIAHNAHEVTIIHLQIGPLSGVDPKLLANAYNIARAGTLAATAELKVEILPVRIRCVKCGAETETTQNNLVCVRCGAWNTQLQGGDELILRNIELVVSSANQSNNSVASKSSTEPESGYQELYSSTEVK